MSFRFCYTSQLGEVSPHLLLPSSQPQDNSAEPERSPSALPAPEHESSLFSCVHSITKQLLMTSSVSISRLPSLIPRLPHSPRLSTVCPLPGTVFLRASLSSQFLLNLSSLCEISSLGGSQASLGFLTAVHRDLQVHTFPHLLTTSLST